MNQSQGITVGRVYLVGAGPGDPRLITLKGRECLRRADLILYHRLVNPSILCQANPSAEAVCLDPAGPQGAPAETPQEQTVARMVAAARQGRTVVYIKGGDPEVFSHGGGQTEALASAGIPLEIVPGVTAGVAAAACAEIPITDCRHGSAVALVTGRQQRDRSGPPLDYGALAGFPGTLVFYMAQETVRQWSRALIGRGKSPQTPVAIVARCSWPDQQTVRCTLGTVAQAAAAGDLRRPMVIVVGEVVSLAPEVSWFSARKLTGSRILLTRPRRQVGPLRDRLSELGADVIVHPAIRIGDPADWAEVDAALVRLDRYDWLVFSSVNGVRYLIERLLQRGCDLRRLGPVKLAAIGPATAEELRRYHLRVDLVPEEYRAEALAGQLAVEARGHRFLLARASRGREVLAERLTAAGGTVDQIVVYSSTDVEQPEEEVAAAMSAGRIDWVTVTSSAIARSLVALFGEQLRQTKLASISPITSETLRQLGHEPAAEATQYTSGGLVEAILACG